MPKKFDTTEAREAARRRRQLNNNAYISANYKKLMVLLHTAKDADLIAWLERQENKSQVIRDSLAMYKERQEEC